MDEVETKEQQQEDQAKGETQGPVEVGKSKVDEKNGKEKVEEDVTMVDAQPEAVSFPKKKPVVSTVALKPEKEVSSSPMELDPAITKAEPMVMEQAASPNNTEVVESLPTSSVSPDERIHIVCNMEDYEFSHLSTVHATDDALVLLATLEERPSLMPFKALASGTSSPSSSSKVDAAKEDAPAVRRVCLKIWTGTSPDALRECNAEELVLTKLNQCKMKGVPSIYASGKTSANFPVLVLNSTGKRLSEFKKKFPLEYVQKLVANISAVLLDLDKVHVLHRNIKPSTITVDKLSEASFCLVDFSHAVHYRTTVFAPFRARNDPEFASTSEVVASGHASVCDDFESLLYVANHIYENGPPAFADTAETFGEFYTLQEESPFLFLRRLEERIEILQATVKQDVITKLCSPHAKKVFQNALDRALDAFTFAITQQNTTPP